MERIIALDLDGTLTISNLHLLPAYRQALQEMGREPEPEEKLLRMIGGTHMDNQNLLMPGEPEENYTQFSAIVQRLSAQIVKEHGRAYPGMREALSKLREEGYLTVLCSNGRPEYTRPVLEATGLSDCISHIHAARPGTTKAELLGDIIAHFQSQQSTVMVGDRCFDARAALANNVPFIGCLYGLFPQEVRDSSPQVMIHDAYELVEAVHRLIPVR